MRRCQCLMRKIIPIVIVKRSHSDIGQSFSESYWDDISSRRDDTWHALGEFASAIIHHASEGFQLGNRDDGLRFVGHIGTMVKDDDNLA